MIVAFRTHGCIPLIMLNLIQEPGEPSYIMNVPLNGST